MPNPYPKTRKPAITNMPRSCPQCFRALGESQTICAECMLKPIRESGSELPGFPSGWRLGRDPWPYSTGNKKKGEV